MIETPGHTLGHISYYLPAAKVAFVADTLFALGCGRVFEGTPEMMWHSLEKLMALPDDTDHLLRARIHPGQRQIRPDDRAGQRRTCRPRQEIDALRAEGKPTLPTTIGGGKGDQSRSCGSTNRASASGSDMEGASPAAVFGEIRKRKDNF